MVVNFQNIATIKAHKMNSGPQTFSINQSRTMLAKAISKNETSQALELINSLGSIQYEMSYGVIKRQTPLHLACQQGNIKIVEALLNKGANPLIIMTNSTDQFSCLDHAMCIPDLKVMKKIMALLLKKDPTIIIAPKKNGETALHRASHPQFLKALEFFVSFNKALDVNITNEFIATPLHLAAATNNEPAVRLLLNAGANPKLIDVYGKRASDYCSTNPSLMHVLRSQEYDLFERVSKVISENLELLADMIDGTADNLIPNTVTDGFSYMLERFEACHINKQEISDKQWQLAESHVNTTTAVLKKLSA